jgi:hypothetical protein
MSCRFALHVAHDDKPDDGAKHHLPLKHVYFLALKL